MKKINNLKQGVVSLITVLLFLTTFDFCFAAIIKDEKGNRVPWDKAQEAYRPSPLVFSHGFASGGQRATWVERDKQKEKDKPKLDEKIEPYFRNYYYGNIDLETKKPIPALRDHTRFPYLELVSYIDFSKSKRSQLIDRNSSIDTYDGSDYYVKISKGMKAGRDEKRVSGDAGWADKLSSAMEKVRDNYSDKNGYPLKINLVCHSMGGLAAREYITNPKYGSSHDKVAKVVMTGVPNLGSPFASLSTGLTRAQGIGWFIPGIGWLFSSIIEGMDRLVFEKKRFRYGRGCSKGYGCGRKREWIFS